MSSLRALLCGFLGTLLAVSAVAAQEVRDTIGPIEKQAKPITPENPIPRRTFSVAPTYPADAQGIEAVGAVALVATIDEVGHVVEIRKAREPLVLAPKGGQTATALRIAADALVREAASALRRWTYDPPANGPMSFLVTFSFKPGADTTATQTSAVPASLQSTGATVSGGTIVGTAGQPIRVGGGVRAPTQTKKVQPVYPRDAMAAGISGVVILEAIIGADGRVQDAKVLRSIPALDQAAVDAVRQWEYTPTLLNGVAMPVVMTVTVTFTLAPPPPPPPPPPQ